MSFTEKQSWVVLCAIVLSSIYYVSMVLGGAEGQALVDTPYMWPLIWSVVATMVVSIVGSVVIAIPAAVKDGCEDEEFEADERDKDIDRRGEGVGYIVFSIGVLNALILTIAEADHFWIGNTIYASGAIASVVGCVVKLTLYKRGF